ncbi:MULTISPECIES: GNAT family N-acetyltransferase [unclassified Oleiphilus]|uniref:GNAT family N-acetyltransferase n=3 Tax=Oleiphilus TaxID=141450 RepID=UPI0007C28E17|nr:MULTISPECIES: GNAT family N-acetyltransferase [unclassified Oleiphilus]KZZ35579.1 hypothetical protein A3756_15185 [Oleiphilus sp. HI0086]KZZ53639.1 hypothetical protein A3761_16295 [Oleiphilus sp. HI0123]
MINNITYQHLDALNHKAEALLKWKELLPYCQHNFFQSIPWVETWLEALPNQHPVYLVSCSVNGTPLSGMIISFNKTVRLHIVHSDGLYLNNTGDTHLDELTTEYNQILVNRTLSKANQNDVIKGLLAHLDKIANWNEVFLPALASETRDNLISLPPLLNTRLKLVKTTKSYFVDLDKIRESDLDYLKLLSSNKRSQIKRSISGYQQSSNIEVQEAESTGQAITMLEELAELHQIEWTKRGKAGAFSNTFFFNFHRKLITDYFDSDYIQVLKIHTKDNIIGYLYNFLYQGEVLFYQCGFNYTDINKLKPGLTSHYFAILLNAKKGYNKYDFLAGESQYKSSLATESNNLSWILLQKNHKRFIIENLLRSINKLRKKNQHTKND